MLSILLLTTLSVGSQAAAPELDVRYAGDRLTIHASAVPLRDVIVRIAQIGAIEVSGAEHLDGTASADLDGRSVPESLEILLSGFNYVLSRKPAAKADSGMLYALRIIPRNGNSIRRSGPISVPALEAAWSAEWNPIDATDDPDALAETQKEEEEEKTDATQELTDLEAAGEFADTLPAAAFEDYVGHDNPLVRHRALIELLRRDPEVAATHAVEALADENMQVSDEAVAILGRRSDAPSLKRLGDILVSPTSDPAARIAAFRALALRADPASTRYVESVANDAHVVIREAAAQFLEEMAARQAK